MVRLIYINKNKLYIVKLYTCQDRVQIRVLAQVLAQVQTIALEAATRESASAPNPEKLNPRKFATSRVL